MKPVNLLPERNRPRTPTGGQKGSSYFLLGGLAILLIAAVAYVLTLNSINSTKGQIATATAQTARDNQLADQLAPYGDFDKIKQQRVASVTQLAEGRFDWEKLVRELSLVLPGGVWLTNVSANASGQANSAGSSSSSSSSSTGSAASSAPSVLVDGCATNQDDVAATLVRLRAIDGASDVELTHSAKPSNGASAGPTGGSSSSSSGCGTTNGNANYSFEATVTLSAPSGTSTAPANLGGGS